MHSVDQVRYVLHTEPIIPESIESKEGSVQCSAEQSKSGSRELYFNNSTKGKLSVLQHDVVCVYLYSRPPAQCSTTAIIDACTDS